MVKRKLIICFTLAVFMCLSTTVLADVKGRLVITVLDTAEKPIKGVVVTLTNKESKGLVYTIETNKKGKATLNGVDPVMYHVKAEKEGYQFLEGDVKLRAGVKVKHEWEMLTLEEAKKQAKDAAWEKLSEEEKNKILAQEAHNEGITAYQNGNVEEAKAKFTEAVGLDPNVSSIDYLLLGQFAFNDHDAEGAIVNLSKAKELDTEKESITDINRLLGACYMIQKDFKNAKTVWGELVETAPDPGILYNLANIEISLDNMDGAIGWLEKCRISFPDNLDSLSLLGDIYLQKKDYAKGLEIYSAYLVQLETDASADPEKLKMARDTVKLLKEQVKK
jgi:tetratricopeptide (TPR) repeat protein